MRPIQMVDLIAQYQSIKEAVNASVLQTIESGAFINRPAVQNFKASLESYLDVKHVIPFANGTDALQIALMALGLEPGDEVIVPAFTYVATAEVIALLRLKPIMVDVDPATFNITAAIVKAALSPKTKAVVPVHLFGQSVDMQPLIELSEKHGFYLVEDNAQAIGADYIFDNGRRQKTGTLGHVGCTSFYPSKNLGAFGDGGALFTNDTDLAAKLKKIASHGQSKRYYHDCIGVNSRLDSVQAAILNIKLKKLDDYAQARQSLASYYNQNLADITALTLPKLKPNSTHVYHQYTLKVSGGQRDALQHFLKERGVPSMIYYPVPLQLQEAFKGMGNTKGLILPVTAQLCEEVLSLPMHTEMDVEQRHYICDCINAFFKP